jgi:NAD(P)H-hydrate epimerase
MQLPLLTIAQMREVDRLMVDEYYIDVLQMMENAGRSLALLAKRMLDNDICDRPLVVLAGRGNNGGGGLAAARHLLNWGAWVQIVCASSPEQYTGAAARQLGALHGMGAPLAWAEEGWELPIADLIIDALIGYGLSGAPRGKTHDLIALANSSAAPVLSLDGPSGVDLDTGRCAAPHIAASATLTLALPKRGLTLAPGRSACGDLYLADIGVPPQVYGHWGIDLPPIFGRDPILKLNVKEGQAAIDETRAAASDNISW